MRGRDLGHGSLVLCAWLWSNNIRVIFSTAHARIEGRFHFLSISRCGTRNENLTKLFTVHSKAYHCATTVLPMARAPGGGQG